uniref:ubiquitinyl hydrolase 1 n=1 Tax=Timema poppense TaxID=170557 RepID=A0A7R9D546_TIMPO|nr:unnamed protein product [Timema poppensis]
MESNLVAEFVAQTGADSTTAYKSLREKNWDLSLAIQAYRFSLNGLSPSNISWTLPATVAEENGNISADPVRLRSFSRPMLQKSDAVDIIDFKKLTRGISRATDNVNLVSRARSNIESNVCNVNQFFIETPVSTFTLPDLTIYPEDFRGFLEKDLIEMSMLVSLEQGGRLNWWADSGACQRLWPLATTGDGNCLLHAASLGMWGFHDRLLTLRKALYGFMTSGCSRQALWRRWRWQQTQLNAEAGFVYSEEEWLKEWDSIDVNGEDMAPIPFGGIYLPLECSPGDCHRPPLVLTYDAAHFSSLVVMERESLMDKVPQPPAMIPLTDSDHVLLPIQFLVDPGEHFVWGLDDTNLHTAQKLTLDEKEKLSLLHEYLDVVHVSIPLTPCAEESSDPPILEQDSRVSDEDDIEKKFSEIVDSEINSETNPTFTNNKSKAAKQLQSVAKQFGSIGKSVSKKLKKNLGSITKMTRSNSQKKSSVRQTTKTTSSLSRSQDYILCASLHTEKRHEYQEEMVRNYLQSAQIRFYRDKEMKQKQAEERKWNEELKLKEIASLECPSKCINPSCDQLGTAITSYMCRSCFEKQRDQELTTTINSPTFHRASADNSINDMNGAPRYGTGKSRFYTESDSNSHNTISRLPTTRAGSNMDHTLYLSKSTFYNDSACPTGVDTRGNFVSIHNQHPLITSKSEQLSNVSEEHTSSSKRPLVGRYSFGYSYVPSQDPSAIMNNGGSRINTGPAPRLHSYNMARVWENTAVGQPNKYSAGGQHELQQNTTDQSPICNNFDTKFSTRVVGGSAPQNTTITSRNVAVATLNPQSGSDLPNVERVSRPASDICSRVSGGVILPIAGTQPCRTNNCKFFGSKDSDFYCSKCFKEALHSVTSLRVQEMKR